MTNKLSVMSERSSRPMNQKILKTSKRKMLNKNNLWMRTLQKRVDRTKNAGSEPEREKTEKEIKDFKKIKNWEQIENYDPSPYGIRTILLPFEKNLLSVVTHLVRDIYSGINTSGNRELILSVMPSIFRDTRIRVEKTGKARVRIIIDSKDVYAMNFFDKFQDNIKAGLIMRGLILDEFKINR